MENYQNEISNAKMTEQLEKRIAYIDTMIGSPKKLKKEIVSAFTNQQLYDLEGYEGVFWDRDTGLLWQEYDPEGKFFSVQEGKEIAKKLDLGFGGFRLPKINELKILVKSGYLDNINNKEHFLTVNETRSLNYLAGYTFYPTSQTKGRLLACSEALFKDFNMGISDYVHSVKNDITVGCDRALSLMLKNKLIPVFSDEEIYKKYKAYYFEKPELKKQMDQLKKQKENTNSFQRLNAGEILSKYDTAATERSLYEYGRSIKSLCDRLMSKFRSFESENAETIGVINLYESVFSVGYVESEQLTEAENTLFRKGYDIIVALFDVGLERDKISLKNASEYANDLKKRLDEAADSDDMIRELGKIEAEPRASFVLFAEAMIERLNRSFGKINKFVQNSECISYLADAYKKTFETYLNLNTVDKERFITGCEKEYIDTHIAEGWYDDLKSILLCELKAFIDIVERYLVRRKYSNKESTFKESTLVGSVSFALVSAVFDIAEKVASIMSNYGKEGIYKQLCELLEEHRLTVTEFYNTTMKDIYKKYAYQPEYDLMYKIEIERMRYESLGEFRRKLCELIVSASEIDGMFIADCTKELSDMPLAQLAVLGESSDRKLLSDEIFSKLTEMRKKNFDAMKNDAKYFAEEQAKRDKEFNDLVYRMRKELQEV